ncbi:hypothetical protein KKC59_04340, partial [bacterium]|nr:hypothetical protein [bacterium]
MNFIKRILFVIFAALVIFMPGVTNGDSVPVIACENFNIPVGEEILYDVKWNGFKIGQTTLSFFGKILYNNEVYYKITSESQTSQYEGIDIIYVDINTFLPSLVIRKLKCMGKKELIYEYYDQEKNLVEIVKLSENKQEKNIIKREDKIQNSVLLYYLSRLNKYDVGDSFNVVLPTCEYEMNV